MHWFTVELDDQIDFYLDGAYQYSKVFGIQMWLRECDRLYLDL